MGVKVITGNFASEGNVLRHAADHVADTLVKLGLNPAPSLSPPATT